MGELFISKEKSLEYINDRIKEAMIKEIIIENAKYHHNTKYHLTSSIIEHGILHLRDLNSKGIKKYSESFLNIMSDNTSHINGTDGVSLSVRGLKDLNPKEEEYDPFNEKVVDILIDSDIKTYRNSTNYGNEFISYNSINRDKFRSIDIRLLKLIRLTLKSKQIDKETINNIINKYNSLINISRSMYKYNLDIPLREMSFEETCLDIDLLSKNDTLRLK